MSLKSKMPLQVWILTLSAFAIGTAEFVIAGVLPQVTGSLRVTEGQAGNLITAYALAIVGSGPTLTLWLARVEKRKVLIGLMATVHRRQPHRRLYDELQRPSHQPPDRTQRKLRRCLGKTAV